LAYIDKNKNKSLPDLDELQNIGFKLPIEFDNEGMTTETLEAVKQNLMCLLSTELGERLYQPNLGIRLRRFLFEPFSEDMATEIKAVIHESITLWLPFLIIKNIHVQMSEITTHETKNTLEIQVDFSLKKNPTILDSVQVVVGGGGE
jgi:phage baseplate assembly protein W